MHSGSTESEAVVFDVGNVLIRWNPHPAVAAGVGEAEARQFLTAEDFSFGDWNREQDVGRSLDDAEAVVAASHPQWLDHVRAYRRNFDRSLLGAIEGTVTILRELHRAGVPLFALTNFSAEFFPIARERFGFLDLFDDILVSGAVGMAKPEPEIFALTLARVRRPASRVVFVDDTRPNVAAAARAGFDAVIFTGAEHLRRDLCARGLPLAAS